MNLWPHQRDAIETCVASYRRRPRSRTLIQFPTGTGKTEVAKEDLAWEKEIKLISIDDPLFGGWAKAQATFFNDGGLFDQVFEDAKK